jgi:hypothetical protein
MGYFYSEIMRNLLGIVHVYMDFMGNLLGIVHVYMGIHGKFVGNSPCIYGNSWEICWE